MKRAITLAIFVLSSSACGSPLSGYTALFSVVDDGQTQHRLDITLSYPRGGGACLDGPHAFDGSVVRVNGVVEKPTVSPAGAFADNCDDISLSLDLASFHAAAGSFVDVTVAVDQDFSATAHAAAGARDITIGDASNRADVVLDVTPAPFSGTAVVFYQGASQQLPVHVANGAIHVDASSAPAGPGNLSAQIDQALKTDCHGFHACQGDASIQRLLPVNF
jgi:hypothetical protein